MTYWQNMHYLARPMEVSKCTNEFLPTVTESVVHSVNKVVTRSCFSIIRQHKASGSKWSFYQTLTTAVDTACSVNATPDLERYEGVLGGGSITSENMEPWDIPPRV